MRNKVMVAIAGMALIGWWVFVAPIKGNDDDPYWP